MKRMSKTNNDIIADVSGSLLIADSQGEPDIDYVSWLEKKLIKNHGVSHHVISTFKCPHGLDCKEPCVMHGKGNHSMCY